MFKNVATKIPLFAFTVTTGIAKTGDAANLTAYVSKDYGAVTVLADTSATEMDATNAPGWYLFDVAQAETNADALLFTAKSGTANISVVGQHIFTTPPSFTAFVTPTGAAVNATQFAGQTITAAAGVTLPSSVASPTNITAGTITTVTTVTGLTASDVGAIKTKTDFLPSATAGAAGGVFIAGTNAATAITTALTANIVGNVTGNLSGSVGSVTGAVGSVTGAVGSVASGGIAAASFAAGAIDAAAIATDAIDADAIKADAVTEIQAGLSTSAAVATLQTSVDDVPTNAELATALGTADDAVLAQVALVKAKTDNLPAAPAAVSDIPTAAAVSDAVWDEALAGHVGAGSTGAALTAASGAGDPWVTALPGAYSAGSAGFILGTNVDALISSRTKPADTQAAVTTVTNLTNAPTSGDFTATMKTSLNAATPAATVSDKTGFSLSTAGNAAVADKLLGRNLAGGSDGTRMVKDALRSLRNKTSITAGTLTVTEEDDTTPAWTAVVTTNPGDPLTSIDPA